MASRVLVVVVDDDLSVRESLPQLLGLCGFAATAFASAHDFLASGVMLRASCLILDIAMPGMSGIDLARLLTRRGAAIPIVFITATVTKEIVLDCCGRAPSIACSSRLARPSYWARSASRSAQSQTAWSPNPRSRPRRKRDAEGSPARCRPAT